MRKRRKMTTKQCPFKTEIERVYRVCGFAYKNNRPEFLRNFTESMIKVYGECPTPLSVDTLKQFQQTSEPEDYQEVFKMIHVWKSLLEKHYPDLYVRFDEIYEAFVEKDREDEEAEAREAEAREDRARARQEFLELYKRRQACVVPDLFPSVRGPSLSY
jgi:predicted ribosome quality control (RQC) complex YloA/Tae2 family protein